MHQDSIKPINTNHCSLNTYTASSDLQSRGSEYGPLKRCSYMLHISTNKNNLVLKSNDEITLKSAM